MELDFANEFNNTTSQWRQITSLFQSRYAHSLGMISTLFFVILGVVSWAVLKSKREGTPDEASSPSKEAKKKPGLNRVKLRIIEILVRRFLKKKEK